MKSPSPSPSPSDSDSHLLPPSFLPPLSFLSRPHLFLSPIKMEALQAIIEKVSHEGEVYFATLMRKVMTIVGGVAEAMNAAGKTTRILSPLSVIEREIAPSMFMHLLPIVLTKEKDSFVDQLEAAFAKEKILGFARLRLHNAPGVAITLMRIHVCHVFPLFEDRIDGKDSSSGDIDPRYYLPSIYRSLEEDPLPPPQLFEMEMALVKRLRTDIPFDRFLFSESSGPIEKMHSAVMTLPSVAYLPRLCLTGSSAALIELGVSSKRVPFPIELATESIEESMTKVKAVLDPFGKVEARQFGVGHPSGNWYFTVLQFIVNERLIVMLFDTIRYTVFGLADASTAASSSPPSATTLSPFSVMAQLCYSAWLIERRGNDKSKWLYSLLLRLREKYCAGLSEKKTFSMFGDKIEWPVNYLKRTRPLK